MAGKWAKSKGRNNLKLGESTVYLNISVGRERAAKSERKREGKIVVNEEKRKPEWWKEEEKS